jgi:hypothetical protein
VDVHHFNEAENQERWQEAKIIASYLACQKSKWFYDTSTGTAKWAAHCGSFCWKGIWSLGH